MYQLNSRSGLKAALLLGAAGAAIAAYSTPAEAIETVVVTGSRIPQTGLYSASPVTTVTTEEIKAEGKTDVVDILQALPQVVVDQNGAQNNGVTGAANVDLRGLGASRTLVLVNGTRLMPGDPQAPVADLNDIPTGMIDHVEVLTGGASAVYGSDALAGVVNFIMRKDFEGIELDGQFGGYEADNTNQTDIAAAKASLLSTPLGSIKPAPQGILDGGNADVTLILGANTPDDKGNVTGWIGYHRQSPVLWPARDYSACTFENKGTTGHKCVASSNFNRWISIDNGSVSPTGVSTATDNFQTGSGPGTGHFVPFSGSSAQRFNFAADNAIQRGDTRYTGGFFAHYEVSKRLEIYSSLMFADDHTMQPAGPTALFLGAGTVFGAFQETNCTNPLMTAQENRVLCGEITTTSLTAHDPDVPDLDEVGVGCETTTPEPATCDVPETMLAEFGASGPYGNGYDTCTHTAANPTRVALGHDFCDGKGNIVSGQSTLEVGRRLSELGIRRTDQRHNAFRIQAGFRGELGDGWTYDIYGQIGISRFTQILTGDASKNNIQNALEVDPLTGQCFGAEATPPTAPGCVPLDVFNGIGSVTPTMAAYISTVGILTGYTREHILSAIATGDLSQWGGVSPWAKDPIGASGGVEYRSEDLALQADQEYSSNDLAGAGGATKSVPQSGFHVTEFFTEFRVPIIQDAPFAKDLSAELGYRYSIYTPAGDTNTWKADLNWQVTDDFKLRGGFNRAVRAPNVNELFTPQNNVLFSGADPCATSVTGQCATVPHAGSTLLECPASQCNNLTGGNPLLKPEVAFTETVGVVLTPTFLDNFTATIDFFNIKVSKFIGKIAPGLTLTECYGPAATPASEAFFCPLVHRNAFGQIFGSGFVQATNLNTGFLETSGVDFGANWAQDLDDWGWTGDGSLSASFLGTYARTSIVEPLPGLGQYDCVGLYGSTCGVPLPSWRHRLRVTWQSPWDVDFSVNWRYFGATTVDQNSSNPLLGAPGSDKGLDNHIADYNWFDVSFNWRYDEHLAIRGGVNNVFGKSPPTLSDIVTPLPFGNANTWPGTYDYLGRQFFIGGTIKY